MSIVKHCALVLALAMLITALAACGGTPSSNPPPASSEPTQAPAVVEESEEPGEAVEEREPATFTFLTMMPPRSTYNLWETPVGKRLQEITNVTLEIEDLVGSDVRQKASLLIASGDYPDLIYCFDASGDFYAADALIPLNDYMKNSKNLSQCYSEKEQALATQEDGNLYWLSRQATENAVYPSAAYFTSMDLLAQADYPMISDFYEWQDAIVAYIEKNPTYNGQPNIAFSIPTEAHRASSLEYGASRFLAGFPNDGLVAVNPETFEAKVIMAQDYQKEFVKMMNRFYNLGTLDSEMFMQTAEQYQAKIAAGRVISTYDWRSYLADAFAVIEDTDPSRAMVGLALVLPGVETERYRGSRSFNSGTGLGISVACKDPDRAFQFLDDLAGDEAQTALYWGVEGTDWQYDANGGLSKSDEQWTQYRDAEYLKSQGIGQFSDWLQFHCGLDPFENGTIASPANTPEYVQRAYKPYELDFLSHYADRGYSSFVSWFKPSYDAYYQSGATIRQRIDTTDPRKIAGETALELTLEYMPQLVEAKPDQFEAKWAEFVAVLDALPLKEYEELVTQMIRDSLYLYE
ncbi:MAG: extracellular solute-binding protein [Christensenellaceae bacterium]|jgi:putative aldouronate transport system substrate-binding protein|nr:extracellular solute-binding protein [Christensenellaceae bacterium]